MKGQNNTDKVINSHNLHKEWTDERKNKGLKEISAINNAAGTSTGNLARMDSSWKNAPDFFIQMIKKIKRK